MTARLRDEAPSEQLPLSVQRNPPVQVRAVVVVDMVSIGHIQQLIRYRLNVAREVCIAVRNHR